MTAIPLFTGPTVPIAQPGRGKTSSLATRHPVQGLNPGDSRQRGAMAIPMLLLLLGLVTMLGLIEVGYLYWAKRDTQKVADLSALAGAQQLQDCASNNDGNSAAYGNAYTENGFNGSGSTLTITCGTWDPTANASIADHFTTVAPGVAPNAVKVQAKRPVLPIWGFAGTLPDVSTEAIASTAPSIAVFSVGTTLVAVDGSSTLGQLLKGIGIPLSNTSLVGYEGLANVNITPAGLLQQLGVEVPANISVGDLNTLLASQLSAHALIDVLNAIVTVAGQSDLASANVSLLNTITAQIPNLTLGNVTLGGPGGLFAQIVAPDSSAQAALNANVNALQLIATAIGVGTGKHAVTANLSIPANSTLGILSATVATSVIEPPSIGIGGVGTTAYTAQVRTFIDINVSTGGIPLIGGLISLNFNLPMAIDLVTAQGKLTDLCDTTSSTGQPQATIAVTSSLLKVCVGNITQADAFSTAAGCDQIPGAGTPVKLLALTAAGVNLASLTTAFAINPLPANGSGTLSVGQSAVIPAGGNQLAIGTTINNLVNTLLATLIANPGTQPPTSSSSVANQIATDLWNGTNTSLSYAARTQQALGEIQSASTGLQGLLGNVTGSVVDALGNVVQLNVPGILGDVGNLLGGVTGALSSLVTNLTCSLGNKTACIITISGALSGGGSGTNSNAFIGLLGFLVQALQGPLDRVGSSVLTPLLQNTLGLDLGQTTVDLQSMQCHRVQLVY